MICLGMVAEKFSEHTQNRVLIPAFLRGLQDPFVPCRSKALAALAIVIRKHDPAEVGRKVMPTVAPLCCDSDHSVRQNAISCCRSMLDVLTENSDTMHVAEQKAAAEAKAKEEEAAAKQALNPQPTEPDRQPQAPVSPASGGSSRVVAARNPAPAPAPVRKDEDDGWDLDDDSAFEDAERKARMEEQRLRQKQRREDAERRRRERESSSAGAHSRPATAPATSASPIPVT